MATRGKSYPRKKKKKNGKNSKSMNASNRRDAGFSRGEEEIGSTEEGGGNSGVGPLHQFARDAAVYLTNDQILYAKKSTTGRGGMYSPVLGGNAYIFTIYMYIHTFFHRLSNTFHVAATRSPRSSSSCILRDILEWREANGNRQMIHEDVKRDV